MVNSFYQSKINSLQNSKKYLNLLSTMPCSKEKPYLELLNKVSVYKKLFKLDLNGEELYFDVTEALEVIDEDINAIIRRSKKFPQLFGAYTKSSSNGENWTNFFLVKSDTLDNAIELLYINGYEVYGRYIDSPYDCTGKAFSNGVYKFECKWIPSKKAYLIPVRWGIDC